MSTSGEREDVVLDIDSLKAFTIPKRKKAKTGTVVDLNQRVCEVATVGRGGVSDATLFTYLFSVNKWEYRNCS